MSLRLKGKKETPKIRFRPVKLEEPVKKQYVFILHSIDGEDIDKEFDSLDEMVAYCKKVVGK